MSDETELNNVGNGSGDSKEIITNQPGIHEKLEEVVRKHLAHASKNHFSSILLMLLQRLIKKLKVLMVK